MEGRRTGRIARAAVAAAVLSGAVVVSGPVGAQEPGLEVVGEMIRPPDGFERPMVVDKERSLGFVVERGFPGRLFMMDLENLVVAGAAPMDFLPPDHHPESGLAMDTARRRLYAMERFPGPVEAIEAVCPSPVRPRPGVLVFDYTPHPDGRPALAQRRMGPLPCWGPISFSGLTTSYDAAHDRLYVGGVPASEAWRSFPLGAQPIPSLAGGTLQEDRGQPLIVRQLAVSDGPLAPVAGPAPPGTAAFSLEWSVDLRMAGCGRREAAPPGFDGFVGRVGDDVLAYCWDARPHQAAAQGQQGYVVRIPLAAGPNGVMRPRTLGDAVVDPVTGDIVNYVFRRTPTLPGPVTPILDPVSGRLMLVTEGSPNGNAVWVFDPRTEQFVGVVGGDIPDEPPGNLAAGFDEERGRLFVLTRDGILVAPVRADPVPEAVLYPVLANGSNVVNFASSNRIAVAPALRRLYVPVGGRDVVVAVTIPDVTVPPPDDPGGDRPGGGGPAAASGEAIASGARLLDAGGLHRAVGQTDPTCRFAPPNLQTPPPATNQQDPIPDWELAPALVGSCLPELLVSTGHRDATVAAGRAAAGREGGTASAEARGAVLSLEGDTGTDEDVRRAGECGASTPEDSTRWGRRWPFPDGASINGGSGPHPLLDRSNKRALEDQVNSGRDAFWAGTAGPRDAAVGGYREGCDDVHEGVAAAGGPDARAGTAGGGPVPASACEDDGKQRSDVSSPTSSASCHARQARAEAAASAGPVAVPETVSAARVWSEVSTVRSNEGQVTVALAVAEGVTVGPLSIARVRSLAVTAARGRPGTAAALVVREWCGVRVGDQAQEGCIDPDSAEARDFLAEANSRLGRVRVTVPEALMEASPEGDHAVATKHPRQRASDRAVNDDDARTVGAMEIAVYNDGPRGRSRVVVQVAGVHAESRHES